MTKMQKPGLGWCCGDDDSEERTGIFEHHFTFGALQDILLHRVLADKAIDANVRLLANSMSTGHRLEVILGIPVALEDREW